MRRILLSIAFAALSTLAVADQDIVLGAWLVPYWRAGWLKFSGQPIREVAFTPAACRPRSTERDLSGRADVRSVFPAKNRKGKVPLLMWHGGGLTGVTYETTPDGREGWLNMFVRMGWDTYIRTRSSAAAPAGRSIRNIQGEPVFLTQANSYERFRIGGGEGTWNADPAKRNVLPGSQFPSKLMRISPSRGAALAHHRRRNHRRLYELVDKVCPASSCFTVRRVSSASRSRRRVPTR